MSLSSLRALALACACGALVLAAAACTASPGGPAAGAPSPAVPAAGHSGVTASQGAAASASPRSTVPAFYTYKDLPAGWKTYSSWQAKLAALAGPKAKVIDESQGPRHPDEVGVGREWAAPGFRELSYSALQDKADVVLIDCFADGYDPAATGAAALLGKLLRQCVSADFPGADTAAAQSWVEAKLPAILATQRKSQTADAGVPYTKIGDAEYSIGAGYISPYGFGLDMQIRGARES